MNHPPTNPRVARYVVSVERTVKKGRKTVNVTTYLAKGEEVATVEQATHWGAPRQAYTAMDIYGLKVAERSAKERKEIFMAVLDTRAAVRIVGLAGPTP